MWGPIAAAALATAVASSSRSFTAAMLPVSRPRPVSVRGRSLVDVVGEIQEVDVPWRLPHPRQQDGGVAHLLLRVRVDMQQVVPKRKTLCRCRPWIEVVDLREPLVVERGEPRLHLVLVAAPVVDKRLRRRIVGEWQLLLPDLFGLPLQARSPALLDVEGVHERGAQVARRDAGGRQELRPRELRGALEHAVLHPVAETEERLEVLPAHGFERNPAMRRRTSSPRALPARTWT